MLDFGATGLPTVLTEGDSIGRYVIRQVIRAGDSAAAYICHDSSLDRLVEIKHLLPASAGAEAANDFRKEAQALVALAARQSGFVAVYDFIENDRGLFIVSQYVDGTLLEDILNEGERGFECKAVLQIIWRLSASLHYMHRAGVIHGRLTPSAIVLGAALRPKITALTCAGLSEPAAAPGRYVAPEVLDSTNPDHRADIYSLGMIAYELLLGRRKFIEILADLAGSEQTLPALNQVDPAIPAAMSNIVARMTAPAPDERFANMESLGKTIRTNFSPKFRPIYSRRILARVAPAAVSASVTGQVGASVDCDEFEIPVHAGANRHWYLKAVLVASLVAGAITAGVMLGFQANKGQAQARKLAGEMYALALADYQNADFVSARKGFSEISIRFADSPEASRAGVMKNLAAARQAIVEADWQMATTCEAEAVESLIRLRRQDQTQHDWSMAREKEITGVALERTGAMALTDAIAATENSIRQGEFEEAGKVLSSRLANVQLTPQQVQRRDALYERIALTRMRKQFHSRMEAARQAAAGADLEAASIECRIAQELLDRSPLGHSTQTAQMQLELDEQLRKLHRQRRLAAAMTSAEAARKQDDLAAVLLALEQAAEIEPSEALSARITETKEQILLRRVDELLTDDQFQQARQVLQEAIDSRQTAALSEKLLHVQDMITKADLLAKVRHLAAAGRFEDAEAALNAAAEKDNAHFAGQIDDVRFELFLLKADRLVGLASYDQAQEHYLAAAKLRPQETATIEARLEALRLRRQYEHLLGEGDAELARRQWDNARERYRKAKALLPDAIADDKIAMVNYAQNMFLGREAMAAGELRRAIAYFRIARGSSETEEVDSLIAEATRRLEAGL